ncbi:hypothetical protein, partial [Streptococcus pseudopneumoniae]
MAKSNTNKRYALRKLGKIFGSVIVGLTLFLGGILNTSFVHAADGIQYVRDDTRDKEEGIEYDDADNGDIIVKVATKPKVVTKKISSTRIRFEKDETKDRSENPVTIDGEDGYVTTTTTYDVNPENGHVTEKVTVEKKEATDTVIKVPAKSKVEREVLPTSVIRFEK